MSCPSFLTIILSSFSLNVSSSRTVHVYFNPAEAVVPSEPRGKMSGAKALAVIEIIANILIDIYERAKAFGHDTNKLLKALCEVSDVLPLIKSSLRHTKTRMD
jgi:hypothetical protein